MASSLSNAKLLATPLACAISRLSINRRVVGYAAAAAAASRGGEEAAGGGKKGSTSSPHDQVEEKVVIREHSEPTTSTSWGPDPVTGYYRPDDRAAAIDTAELRDVALNHKEINKHQN